MIYIVGNVFFSWFSHLKHKMVLLRVHISITKGPLSELVVDHIDGVVIIDLVSNVIFGIHGHKARPWLFWLKSGLLLANVHYNWVAQGRTYWWFLISRTGLPRPSSSLCLPASLFIFVTWSVRCGDDESNSKLSSFSNASSRTALPALTFCNEAWVPHSPAGGFSSTQGEKESMSQRLEYRPQRWQQLNLI